MEAPGVAGAPAAAAEHSASAPGALAELAPRQRLFMKRASVGSSCRDTTVFENTF